LDSGSGIGTSSPAVVLVLLLTFLASRALNGTVNKSNEFYSHLVQTRRGNSSMKHNLIHFRAEFIIKDGKMKEYKKLVQSMSSVVEANEPDTISYRFYFDRDETKCVVHEIYANSEAVFAHNNGLASQTILPKIFSVSRIVKFEVYGNPSKKLQKILESFSPETYNLFAGFSRLNVAIISTSL